MNTIIGAGLAGLLAGHAWPNADILEAAPEPREVHRALLRFRTDAISRLTGIEFRRVRVHKGIWSGGEFQAPSIRHANHYAQKVLGFERISGDRSIWNLDPVDRWIAPESLYEQLLAAARPRISWGEAGGFSVPGAKVSTAPLPVALGAFNITDHGQSFNRAGIRVRRWRIPHADVFQTVYFPDQWTPLYRASITKDLLIAEFADDGSEEDQSETLDALCSAFGVRFDECAEPLGDTSQKYGKIEPIPDAARKALLFKLTHEQGLYSLGRFATWRNILLDDVVDDIAAIKRLLVSGGAAYDLHKFSS